MGAAVLYNNSYGKRSAPPPPPSNPPPALQVMETSEESATESDAPIARPFQVPRPRSRASALVSLASSFCVLATEHAPY